MGETHSCEALNKLTESEEFFSSNFVRLRFKPIFEERKIIRMSRNLMKLTPRMMIKVYVLYASSTEIYNWKSADRWYLSMDEFEAVKGLLLQEDSQKADELFEKSQGSRQLCPVCLEGLIERRFPQCEVGSKQHGFCNRCIVQWLSRYSTCPICRQEMTGRDADIRIYNLLNSVRFVKQKTVQNALWLICHVMERRPR